MTSPAAAATANTNGTGPAAPNTPPPVHWQPLTFNDLMNLPPKPWLVQGVIGERDIGMLYGEPGSGKTFLVIDLVCSACLGRDWCGNYDINSGWTGKFKIKRPLTVAYFAGEGVSGLGNRFRAAADFHGIAVGGLPNLYFFQMTPQLADGRAGHLDGVETFLREWQQMQAAGQVAKLDLLIIDTLHTATAGMEENSAKDAGIALDRLRKVTRILDCAVLLVHHSQKNGDQERGSSSLRGAMDSIIQVSKNGENTMKCSKLKDGEPWQPQAFILKPWPNTDSVVVFWEGAQTAGGNHKGPNIGDQVFDFLSAEPNRRFTSGQLAKALGLAENKVSNALTRLASQGKAYRHTVGDKTRTQPGRHVCEWQDCLGAKSP